MRVWILTESHDIDGIEILGVYATPQLGRAGFMERAEKLHNKLACDCADYDDPFVPVVHRYEITEREDGSIDMDHRCDYLALAAHDVIGG